MGKEIERKGKKIFLFRDGSDTQSWLIHLNTKLRLVCLKGPTFVGDCFLCHPRLRENSSGTH